MSTTEIRQKLHQYLEVANDKKVKAIYTMVEGEIEDTSAEYSDELKQELDRRQESYIRGAAKMISAAESKKRIEKILNHKAK